MSSHKLLISKTTFRQFLHCPKNIWLKLHKPELLEKYTPSEFELHLMEQGNEVESFSHCLFPAGMEIKETGDAAVEETKRLMASRVPAIFQATFVVDEFIVKTDVLVYDKENDCWDLFEVKASNSVDEAGSDPNHLDDIAFQVSVLNRSHVKLGRRCIVHLNGEYVREGALSCHALFKIVEMGEKIDARLPKTEQQMEVARQYLLKTEEPGGGCDCVYKGRKKHCMTFQYSHPEIPDYSVHDLSRVSKKKLDLFVERNIYDLNDIPADFDLTDNQRNQVQAYQLQHPIIKTDEIQQQLAVLRYPLYFFDYEAFNPAIPVFNGYSPFQHIPFQFSLHILDGPNVELRHFEFLHEELSDPSEEVANLLEERIPRGGTVVVWHKTFEEGINKQIAKRCPAHATSLEAFNSEIYDLETIFADQHYVHHGFHGSSSIKRVLPALAPELSYAELEIHEGAQASNAWWTMVAPQTRNEEKARIAKALRTYCERDTYAMYAIWKHLHETV